MPFPIVFSRLLRFGRSAEIRAIEYLRSLGYRVVSTGYRSKGGEIDIVAWEGDVLVFVEVKARHSGGAEAAPEDAVGPRKHARMIRAAQAYMTRYRLTEAPFRFDIVALTENQDAKSEFRLLRDAFTMYN